MTSAAGATGTAAGRSDPERAAPSRVSVVLPSRNEAACLPAVLTGLAAALGEQLHEIIVVDDSDDGVTVGRLEELALTTPSLRWWHRGVGTGLATAVVEGMRAATGAAVVVMDADGQHPPAVVPQLVAALRMADVAVGSRYAVGGSRAGLSGWHRLALSRGSRGLAHVCCARLRATSDPMSGFFALRAGSVDVAALRPAGWKILAEVLTVADRATVVDVPFVFADRVAGQSRLDRRAQWESARHLFGREWDSPADRRRLLAMGGAAGILLGLAVATAARRGTRPDHGA